jgi:hypothetical protein
MPTGGFQSSKTETAREEQMPRTTFAVALVAASITLSGNAALAAGKYDPGASDTEITVAETGAHAGD